MISACSAPPLRCVIALLAALCLSGCGLGGDPVPAPIGRGPSSSTAAPGHAATSLSQASSELNRVAADVALERQSEALSEHDRAAFLACWAPQPAAQRQAARLYANLTALGVEAQRPQSAAVSVSDGGVRGGDSAWTRDEDVAWRLTGSGASSAFSIAHLTYRFERSAAGALISSVVATSDDRRPVWLLPRLVVRQTPRTMVAAGDAATAARVNRLLVFAVAAVRRVLPAWRGQLVAYAPTTARAFAALVAADPHQYDGIAAVTTTVDGSDRVTAPVAIVLNPAEFGSLGPIGAHVVVTHEATHVATHAATATMPLWLAEGFADYVGVGSTEVAMSVAARAAIRVVQRDGAPESLPSDAAFAVGGAHLEATYEEAWLAAVVIARRYGRLALVAFYRWVEAHPATPSAGFSAVLHTSRAVFTRRWRHELEVLAGGR